MGADNVTTYPVTVKGGTIAVDLSEPEPEQVRDAIMDGFGEAFREDQKGRMTRELARLHYNGLDPLFAVTQSILWSYDKFEYGMKHSYAALADWLALYSEEDALEEKLICLSEGISYIAHNATRYSVFPFGCQDVTYDRDALVAAIESEDASLAESLAVAGLSSGMGFGDFEEVLTEMALEHYNDFGHTLIYVYKASQLCQSLENREVDKALVLSLVRSLAYTTREDLIPDFKAYGPALAGWSDFGDGEQVDTSGLAGQRVGGALFLVGGEWDEVPGGNPLRGPVKT